METNNKNKSFNIEDCNVTANWKKNFLNFLLLLGCTFLNPIAWILFVIDLVIFFVGLGWIWQCLVENRFLKPFMLLRHWINFAY